MLQFCIIDRSGFGCGEVVGVTVISRMERYFGVLASSISALAPVIWLRLKHMLLCSIGTQTPTHVVSN